MDEAGEVLEGGNASGPVVRVRGTVRKSWTDHTSVVHAYLTLLRSHGVDVPEPLGVDDSGRQILEFVEGTNALDQLPLELPALHRIGEQIRRIHDVSELFPVSEVNEWSMLLPATNPDLMCHNDLAPWNLIRGERWVFIDWDGAGPSTRLWDLAYAAQSFATLVASEPVEAASTRLRAFVDGYRADAALREALPGAMSARTAAMFDLLHRSHRDGTQPWADMFGAGHGEFWRSAHEYVEQNRPAWKRALSD
jgi:tRNA A-37 threonylcarbamoyl transferase component Bud32